MALDALRRITDLFDEGRELVIRDITEDGGEPVLVWVNKLNSFETDEARADGAAARARFVLALKEVGTDEMAVYEASLQGLSAEAVKQSLVGSKANEFFLEASSELRVDPEWRERVAMIERAASLPDPGEAELQTMAKVNADYVTEIRRLVDLKNTELTRDLAGLDLESLREKHREKWMDQQGLAAFSRNYQQTQIYFALRLCSARTKTDTGAWDHTGCNHMQRACDDRSDVKRLPGKLVADVLTSLARQSMSRDDARFLDVPTSSSARSAPASEAGESTPSTPEATSGVLVTT